ncbi:hypothetical protein AADG42_15110 [Ammonicoccus fulvus]|uniref:Uncharacterized protein n=1 Tax=Ammonicoccus fulvus TaxID=3138240 RepID=A0ABZ3FT56_9ACTN
MSELWTPEMGDRVGFILINLVNPDVLGLFVKDLVMFVAFARLVRAAPSGAWCPAPARASTRASDRSGRDGGPGRSAQPHFTPVE